MISKYYNEREYNDTGLTNVTEYRIYKVDIILKVSKSRSRIGTNYIQLWK